MRECTEETFLRDVAKHEMTIIRDDGVYRHIRFRNPESGSMYFDFVTWPGYLAYSGDMGCYVFSRLNDMFEFFRTDRALAHKRGKKLGINLGYWSEKLKSGAAGGRQWATQFSEEAFNRVVLEYIVRWIRENANVTTKDERRYLWDAVVSEVIELNDDDSGSRRVHAACDFSHSVNSRAGIFSFQDFCEHDLTEFTFHFTWCCYALAWGVQKYDEMKGGA